MNKFYYMVLVLSFMVSIDMAASMGDNQSAHDSLSSCPNMVNRSEWKARKARSSEPLIYSPAPYVVVHHGGIKKYCTNQLECSSIVRSYQNIHLDERGWFDIGYNFVIGEDGNVYEGRGWDKNGAHAPGYNSQSIGVCIIGEFTDRLPNEAALNALHSLMSCGVTLGKLRKNYQVIGHRQARATECPGEIFYDYIKSLPNWTLHPVPIRTASNTTSTTVGPTAGADN